MFLTADGEKDKTWGNETIRWNPDQNWLEIRLPAPLARLANRPHGRYRLSCPVQFPYRGGDVAAQAATGAIRYDICLDPGRGRWYLDASWKTPASPPPGSGTGSPAWRPTRAWPWWRWTRRTPPAGERSTGSPPCDGTTPSSPATTRQRS